ncbi:MAG: response regulator, partial [Candidatus Heimdallarchaeota archaeon]|nr:response regulator [Candidatus Heimdallarchaeota archaeon]
MTSSLGVALDITELKKVQQELIQAKEKAEESDRLKTAFLNNMSHEIRTPLNVIKGFTEMLNNVNLSDEKRMNYTKIINDSGSQLLSIVSDIVSISTIEAGQEQIRLNDISLNDLLLDLLSFFEPKANSQNLKLYLKQGLCDKQLIISTDYVKVRQILTNLISNALKFTHQGFIEIGYFIENNFIEFYVKDTGNGIKPELHGKIFERFRQGEITISRKYGGSGLGLSISKSYVKLMGGKIWLRSESGQGSTFFFTIPYKPVDKSAICTSASDDNEDTQIGWQDKTILLVEDEEINHIYFEEILEETSVNLVHAKNGEEAIEYCRNLPEIDIVLMDIKLPDLNGYEVTGRIKQIRR